MRKFKETNPGGSEQENDFLDIKSTTGVDDLAVLNENKIEGEQIIVSLEKAREIMGDHFFGPDQVERAFDMEVKNIPDIPYRSEVLKKAADLGAFLNLRVDTMRHGESSTMQNLETSFNSAYRFESTDIVDFKQEPFFTKEHPNLEWKLVFENYISQAWEYHLDNELVNRKIQKADPDKPKRLREQAFITSQGKNYFYSTLQIYKVLGMLDMLSEKEKNEFPNEQDLIKKLNQISDQVVFDWRSGNGYEGGNWREIAKQLANLSINKHRRTAAEHAYDNILEGKASGNSPYGDSSRSFLSDGRLVVIGGNQIHAAPHPGYEFPYYGTAIQL